MTRRALYVVWRGLPAILLSCFVTTSSAPSPVMGEGVACGATGISRGNATLLQQLLLPGHLEPLSPFFQLLETSYSQRDDVATFATPSVLQCNCDPSGINELLPHLIRANNGSETLRELLTNSPLLADVCCPGPCGDAFRAVLSNVTYVLHELLEDQHERELLYNGVRATPRAQARRTPRAGRCQLMSFALCPVCTAPDATSAGSDD